MITNIFHAGFITSPEKLNLSSDFEIYNFMGLAKKITKHRHRQNGIQRNIVVKQKIDRASKLFWYQAY